MDPYFMRLQSAQAILRGLVKSEKRKKLYMQFLETADTKKAACKPLNAYVSRFNSSEI